MRLGNLIKKLPLKFISIEIWPDGLYALLKKLFGKRRIKNGRRKNRKISR